jgi:hypothetical protein
MSLLDDTRCDRGTAPYYLCPMWKWTLACTAYLDLEMWGVGICLLAERAVPHAWRALAVHIGPVQLVVGWQIKPEESV